MREARCLNYNCDKWTEGGTCGLSRTNCPDMRISITPEEFADKMTALNIMSKYDADDSHNKADDLMCEILTKFGYGEGVKIFQAMYKYYS